MSILPYTPGNMSYEELRACFVARQPLLDELLKTLADQAEAVTLQHWMILGSRGMGKTHLIRLYYHEITRNPELSKVWIPVLMNEEEPEIFNLATFFTRILTVLAESLAGQNEKDEARRIAVFLDDLRESAAKPALVQEKCVIFLRDFCREKGKRLAVLLENADDLFTKCLPKPAEHQKLRKILSVENFLLLIGASPTFFPGISDQKEAFYDFFRLRRLELLGFDEARELLLNWAREEGDEAREKTFQSADSRLKVLYHLTGGNPRLLYFLYKSVTGAEKLKQAAETFENMLEKDLTAYYLSRMRDIANQVQPIVIALAKSPKNLTQKEIARQSFLPEKSLGTQMQRLEEDGVVTAVSGKKGRDTVYGLSDYLFRVWYQWRYANQSRLILGLVEFLAVWFGRKELESLCQSQDETGYYREARKFIDSEGFSQYFDQVVEYYIPDLRALAKKEDYAGAAKIFESLMDYAPDPKGVKEQLFLDSDLLSTEDIDKVLKVCLDNDPDDIESWKWLGRTLCSQKNFNDAKQALQKAVELKPEDGDAWICFGCACLQQNNYEEAEQALLKAVEFGPDGGYAWELIGKARGELKNHEGAEEALLKAVELVHSNGNAWKWLGISRINQKNYQGAEHAFLKAVELLPEDYNIFKSLGIARDSQNNFVGAEQAFQRVVELTPEDGEAWKFLGYVRGNQGNIEGAEKAFQRSVELTPEDGNVWYWLGWSQKHQKNYVNAEQAFQKAVELKPKDGNIWYELAWVRYKQENFIGVEQAFRKVVELEPKNSHYRNCLGTALYMLDRFDEAANEQLVALKNDRFYAEAYLDQSICHILTGIPAQLTNILEKALKARKPPEGFRAQILLLQAMVLVHEGEKKASLESLQKGVSALEALEDEKRRQVLGKLSDFLIEIIAPHSLESVKTFLARFQESTDDVAILSIVRPLGHVLDYAEACIREKTGHASKKAQTALDRVPGELRGPVEEMAEKVRNNLEWQRKHLKDSLKT